MGRIIGIDYGTVRIGLAASDLTHMIASPISVVKAEKKPEQTIDLILEEIKGKDPQSFVVGLPLLLTGKDSSTTTLVRVFAKLLKKNSKLPVILWDERLTSKQVERLLMEDKINRKNRSKYLDTMSATLILQNYLDSPRLNL